MSLNSIKHFLLTVPRLSKQSLAILTDLCICALATVIAMDLRVEQTLPWTSAHSWMLIAGTVLALPLFTVLGLYRAIFRYSGLQVLYTLNKALLIYSMGFALVFTVVGVPGVPKSMGG